MNFSWYGGGGADPRDGDEKVQSQKEAPFVFRITLVQGLNRQIGACASISAMK